MVVGHGPKGTRPAGRLPVFTTDTPEEAEFLINLACPLTYDGKRIAPELAEEQTIENLNAFSARLADLYEKYVKKE